MSGHLKAGRPIPEPEFYEDYDQLENGVGMMSLFREEFLAELEKPTASMAPKRWMSSPAPWPRPSSPR